MVFCTKCILAKLCNYENCVLKEGEARWRLLVKQPANKCVLKKLFCLPTVPSVLKNPHISLRKRGWDSQVPGVDDVKEGCSIRSYIAVTFPSRRSTPPPPPTPPCEITKSGAFLV